MVKNKHDGSTVQTLGSSENSDLSTVEKNRQNELSSMIKKLYYGLQTLF